MTLAMTTIVGVSAGPLKQQPPAAADSELEVGDRWRAILGAFELAAQHLCQT